MRSFKVLALVFVALLLCAPMVWGEGVISITLEDNDCGWSDWKVGIAQCSSQPGDVDIYNEYSPYGNISVQVEKKVSGAWVSFYNATNNGDSTIRTGLTINYGEEFRMRWFKYSNPSCPEATVTLGFDPSNCPD